MDEDYEGKKWTEEFTDMTQSELMDWARKNRENRKIVFETQVLLLFLFYFRLIIFSEFSL